MPNVVKEYGPIFMKLINKTNATNLTYFSNHSFYFSTSPGQLID